MSGICIDKNRVECRYIRYIGDVEKIAAFIKKYMDIEVESYTRYIDDSVVELFSSVSIPNIDNIPIKYGHFLILKNGCLGIIPPFFFKRKYKVIK